MNEDSALPDLVWKLGARSWTEARLIVAEDEPGFRLWLEWLEEDANAGGEKTITPAIHAAQRKYSIANF